MSEHSLRPRTPEEKAYRAARKVALWSMVRLAAAIVYVGLLIFWVWFR